MTSAISVANVSTRFLHPDDTFDLHDLARHNVLEHDASLAFDDTAPGEIFAPVTINTTRVALLLGLSDDGVVFDENDFGLARHILERNMATPLTDAQQTASAAAPGAAIQAFGSLQANGQMAFTIAALENFFKFNRLPDGFEPQAKPVTRASAFQSLSQILARKAQLNAFAAQL
jgi:hypothetical protein